MITRAGPAHPLAMALIHEAAFPPGENWNAAMFAAQLGLPGVFALIDDAGGMILVRTAADEAEILTLAVAPEARRGGVARALLAAAARAAREAGAVKLFLEVSARNTAALALYQSAGFTTVGTRRRYYADGADALLMAQELTAAATPEP
jgi:ribosomal-protein-alanine N-acetyltransferase